LKILPTSLEGVLLLESEPIEDGRGYFCRLFSTSGFARQGLRSDLTEISSSFNRSRGTLRGMHYQTVPYEEVKLVRVFRGAVYDAVVDLRPSSPTYRHWEAFEINEDNHRALYIPGGFAHGFLTLCDDTLIVYQISDTFSPAHSAGFRWNDPEVRIQWPFVPEILSERDATWPDLT